MFWHPQRQTIWFVFGGTSARKAVLRQQIVLKPRFWIDLFSFERPWGGPLA